MDSKTADMVERSSSDAPPRVVDIAVYGIVNVGKSSLINALARREARPTSPIGGTTKEVAAEAWREVQTELGPYAVRLIDTPGLEEIGGELLSQQAAEAARHADLIVFVLEEDLTASARSAIVALHRWGKPLIVALNKLDLLDEVEGESVLAAIRRNLEGVIPPEHVVGVAAAPLLRRRVEGPDGSRRVETVRGEPEIAALETQLQQTIADAPDLKALSLASEQVEHHVIEREDERAQRRQRAERVADETSAAWALALAVNPVPLLDLLTGPGGLAILVRRVAHAYDESLDPSTVRDLAAELLHGGRIVLWGSLAGIGVGGALKFLPGLGHLAAALAQGVSAALFGHVLGRALVEYFDNGHDWGDGGLLDTLDRIASATDRKTLTRDLVAQLKARLGEHAKIGNPRSEPQPAPTKF